MSLLASLRDDKSRRRTCLRRPSNRTVNNRPTRGKPQQMLAAMAGLTMSWRIAVSAPAATHDPNNMPSTMTTAPTPSAANRPALRGEPPGDVP